jgi:hypothetical protein
MLNQISGFNLFSQLGHITLYSIKKPKMPFGKGMLIVSTDIDVGNPLLGVINRGSRDRDVNLNFSEYHIGKIEEISIPLFINKFDCFDIPMTLAFRGQLTEVGGKILDVLIDSSSKHDIGAHGYYHTMFTELSRKNAEDELQKISIGMKEYGLSPKSFIFPRNRVAHLDLLEKYDYLCYRGSGGLLTDCMKIEQSGNLLNVHPSLFIDGNSNLFLLKKMLDISIRAKSVFHIWFHFWNFGQNEISISKKINNLLVPFLSYAKEKQQNGLLDFETMNSAARLVSAQT